VLILVPYLYVGLAYDTAHACDDLCQQINTIYLCYHLTMLVILDAA